MTPSEELVRLLTSGNAPAGLMGTVVDLSSIRKPIQFPPDFSCHTLIWRDCPMAEFPEGLCINHKLDLSHSPNLTELPDGLNVPVLHLNNCAALTELPEDLRVDFLVIDHCVKLRHWPDSAQVSIGNVSARGCLALEKLPANLGPITTLNLRDCPKIRQIPDTVKVQSWIDIGGTGVVSMPEPLSRVGLRWRGVSVTPQIAFFPETLKSDDVLREANAEVRRVMIERIGFQRFLQEANAKVLHEDRDPGGKRQLLRVELQGDEPLVVVSVNCPSTGRHYLIRVPPTVKTCHEAVAWTAGFDNPDDYAPILET